jgi:1A family penicillin-binding protein
MRRAVAVLMLGAAACSLAPIDLGTERPLPLRTTITAADGTLLARLYRQNRALVPIDSLPKALIDAIVATEDARFFKHPGYDLRSIARAAIVNMSKGKLIQGGSTITQQYVKNTFLAKPGALAPRTFTRKARELRLALEIERRYPKRKILEMYLNTVYLGEGAYGIKAAAETYFGHGAGKLSLHESALLAALIRAPARYDPREYPKRALTRRGYVLGRMVELDMLSRNEADRAADKPLGITPNPPRLRTRQPYFVEAVKREVLADKRLGRSDVERATSLWKGGLRVKTTLDLELQRAAESAVASHLSLPGDPEAALVALEPSTGRVLAMVGGSDWSASQVNLALGTAGGGSGRQPGSAFKPIATAAALEAGVTLDDRFEASPAIFPLPDGSTWTVRNSEGTSAGQLPLSEAMVHSVNGVFARLALEIGPDAIARQAERMGIRARMPIYPSIALGSADVSVLDMASAYATLANGGTAIEPTTIAEIRTPEGALLKPEQKQEGAVVSPGNAYLLTKTLEQVILRGTGRAAQIGRPAAGKTGTTNDYADAWFVGYTPNLVAAVWVGHPRGRIPMTSVHGTRVWGGNIPASIWRSFMTQATKDRPEGRFQVPDEEMIVVEIDPKSGLLAAPWCPGEARKMLRQLVPDRTCPSPPPTPEATTTPSPARAARKDARGPSRFGQPSDKRSPSPTQSPNDD